MATTRPAFLGFPDGKVRPVAVPDLFFTELLPQIDDLAELKLTLHCFWLLNEQSGEYRYLRGADLRTDQRLLDSLVLDNDLRTPEAALEHALERAVARNTLLRLDVSLGPEPAGGETDATAIVEDWYFMNTVKGRQAIALIRQGRLRDVRSALPDEARLRVQRPNIFVLYEQNVGVLTPLLADQLRDMEKSYAPEWIVDAFEIAISRNKRNLRYIQSILKRWETEGRDGDRDETSGRDTEERRRRSYIPDEYSDIILG
jgi:DnaD/phage-associated family protein